MKKLLVVVAGALTAVSAWASISYQGALKLADGSEVTELTKTITFNLYTSPSEDGAIWTGRSSVLLAAGTGLFNVELDASVDSPAKMIDDVVAAHSGDTLYIGLTVDGSNGEIRPRQKLLAVPTAVFAQNVKEAKGDFTVNGVAVCNGAVSARANAEVQGNASVQGNLAVSGKLMRNNTEVMPVPVGGIVMWSKQSAPDGEAWATDDNDGHWAVCSGATVNGTKTPDLRGRFIVGVNDGTANAGQDYSQRSYKVDDKGGEDAHVLSVNEMPSHSHTFTGNTGDIDESWNNRANFFATPDNAGRNAGNRSVNVSSAGGGAAHENRPPYYALYYIMRVR